MLIGRALDVLDCVCDIRVVSVDGGLKDNAIPVESFAVVVVSDEKKRGKHLKNSVMT